MQSLAERFVQSQNANDELDACARAVRKHACVRTEAAGATNLLAMAKAKGISIEHRNDCAFEGMIERDASGAACIVLRSTLNRTRERFTLAHELGHWVLQEELLEPIAGRLFRGLSTSRSETKVEERLASLIAAELLMPMEPVRSQFDPNNMMASLHSICKTFRVSRTAAIRRLADVTDQSFLLLQVVPFRFRDFDTAAHIDDAIYATARRGTFFDRERTRIAPAVPFRKTLERSVRLRITNPAKGVVDSVFESDFRDSPIPHVFLLTRPNYRSAR